MNSKTKIKIYRKVIDEVSKEYEGASDFIRNKINELCLEHGASTRRYVFVILHTQFRANLFSLSFLALKLVLKCQAYRELK